MPRSGRLVEAFACGTAAVVTPVGRVAGREVDFTIGSGGPGQLTARLKARLVAIQRGEAADTHGWVMRLGEVPSLPADRTRLQPELVEGRLPVQGSCLL